MPANVKSLDNQTKHLTREEIDARARAEGSVDPGRLLGTDEKAPKSLKGDDLARRYWRETLAAMSECEILTVADRDTLALYCSMLSRRDRMNELCTVYLKSLGKLGTAGERLAILDTIDGLQSRLQAQEKALLSYAKELALTPTGRAALARKRAAAADEEDPDKYLFGD